MRPAFKLIVACAIVGYAGLFAFAKCNAPKQVEPLYSDYGIDVDSTGFTIWDYDRKVAHIKFGEIPAMDSIFYKDNE